MYVLHLCTCWFSLSTRGAGENRKLHYTYIMESLLNWQHKFPFMDFILIQSLTFHVFIFFTFICLVLFWCCETTEEHENWKILFESILNGFDINFPGYHLVVKFLPQTTTCRNVSTVFLENVDRYQEISKTLINDGMRWEYRLRFWLQKVWKSYWK